MNRADLDTCTVNSPSNREKIIPLLWFCVLQVDEIKQRQLNNVACINAGKM